MLMRNLRQTFTQCREALAKRLQNVCELSGLQLVLGEGEAVDIALTSRV